MQSRFRILLLTGFILILSGSFISIFSQNTFTSMQSGNWTFDGILVNASDRSAYGNNLTEGNTTSTEFGLGFDCEPASITETISNVSCNGGADGAISIVISGGTAPYTSSWSNGETTQNISGLTAGAYVVTIIDADGCLTIGGPYDVTEPTVLSVSGIVTDVICNGGSDGAIDITVSGGTPPYGFSWSNGATTEDISGLVADPYTVTITDANGCQLIEQYNVNEPPAINIDSESVTDITCNGANNGIISVSASGGTGTLTYTLNPGAINNTTGTFSGLTANTYNVSVTDEDGCGPVVSNNLIVIEPVALSIDSELSTDITCNGVNDGTVTVSASGGTGSLVYTLNPGGLSNGTGTFINLPANTYTVSVVDANGCGPVVSGNLLVAEPSSIIITLETFSDITCFGANDGTINVTAIGGTGSLTYTLNPGAISNGTGSFTNLTANTYSVSITDVNGCGSISSNLVVLEPSAISIDSEFSTDVSCNGGSNGSVTVTASGGTGVLIYTLYPGSISNGSGVFNGLVANTYTVSVNDQESCGPVISSNIIVSEPVAISLDSELSTNVTCNGGSDGTITVTASGGSGPLTFTLNPGGISNGTGIFTGLSSNVYTVSVTDGIGCQATVSNPFTISQPTAISIAGVVTDVSCNAGTDGAIDITVTGGTAPYAYVWSHGPTAEDVSGLTAGSYTVTITDANGCTDNRNYIVDEPTAISLTGVVTDVSCNSGTDGSIDITVTGGTTPYTYVWSHGPMTEDVSILAAGSYTVTITDANGCIKTANYTVDEPSAISIAGVVTDVSCNAGTDGAIDITVTGGTAPYTYVWSHGPTTEDVSALIVGSYTLTITDANGCTDNANYTVDEPNEISIAGVVTDVSCNTGTDGAIDITVTGGTAPYTYVWSHGPTTEDVSTLTAGSYIVSITDANGCTDNANYTVDEPTAISISGAVTDVSCNAGSDGAIDITVSGGTAPYTYVWSHGPTTEDAVGLTGGSYTVTVIDAVNCTVNATYNIANPTGITITSESSNDISCNGANDGTVIIIASGGTGALIYTLNPGAISNGTGSFTNLSANTYIVSVTDANGCGPEVSSNLIVADPSAISIDTETSTDISCNGANDGTVSVSASGGTGVLIYTLSPGAISNGTGSFTNLSANTYTVSVTDANGCGPEVSSNLIITEPPAIIIDTEASTDITCNGANDGTVTVTASGGTGALIYTLNPGSISNGTGSFTNLSANTYTVSVTDATECGPEVSSSLVLTNPAVITIDTENSTDISCNGANDGSISILVSGGTSPYEYSVDGGLNFVSNGGSFIGLEADNYDIVVKDVNGCEVFGSTLTITDPPAISIDSETSTDISCNGDNEGTLSIVASGGTSPYEYSIDGGLNYVSNGGSFTALGAGNYDVGVRDVNGCEVFGSTITISEPAQIVLTASITDVSFNGGNNGAIDLTVTGGISAYSFSWSTSDGSGLVPGDEDQSGLTAGTYDVTVTDANGCVENESYIVTEPIAVAITGITTDLSCNASGDGTIILSVVGGTSPYTYDWSTTNGSGIIQGQRDQNTLGAGDYDVIVTDANMVAGTASFTLNEPAAIVINVSVSDVSCNGDSDGEATISASGGSGTFSYEWFNGQTGSIVSNLSQGSYSVTATDSDGCSQVGSFEVGQPDVMSLGPVVNPASCPGDADGTISLNISGGTEPYNITWEDLSSSEDRTNLEGGTYHVEVVDANMCVIEDDIVVPNDGNCLEIPKVFTPNGDGSNDTWQIRGIELYPNARMEIFTRWGKMVYSSSNGYDIPWDGTDGGKALPMDSYQFILNLGDGSDPITGNITIIL